MGQKQYIPHEILLFVLIVTLFIPFGPGKKIENEGVVIKVLDGDTIKVRTRFGSVEKIRLAYIDAPELKQKDISGKNKIGEMARDYLRDLIQGKKVWWVTSKKDIYQRLIAEVHLGKIDISLSLIKNGLAIIYPFSKFQSQSQKNSYLQHFYHSYGTKKGIWGTNGMVNPYHYRKALRNNSRRSH